MGDYDGLGGDLGAGDIDPAAMKKSRISPAMIIVVVGILAVAGVIVFFMLRETEKKMTVEERMEIQKNIFILPAKEQIPLWREHAANAKDQDLKTEALTQLALLNDPEGVNLAIKAMDLPSHKVRGTCAQVLAYYGSPTADAGKPALLKALQGADSSDQRQIVWALVELGEKSIFTTAMDLYRTGELTTVQRLEGGGAFDPLKVAGLVTMDELAKMADDESAAIRQLVANILSEDAKPKWTSVLVKLVQDKDIAVAREAAPGLGRIGDDAARGPLLKALANAGKDSRKRFIEALRDGIGGVGLVLALDTVAKEPEATNWFQIRQLMDMIHTLADPRVGDALIEWVERVKPHPHWRTEVGIALAEVGDVRGAKYIAERMTVEAKDIYTLEKFWQADKGGHMTKGDTHRIVGARMLADLAVMIQDEKQRAELRAAAEDPVIKWSTSKPQPHANALRFLAAIGSEKILPQMRDWAFPDEPLPKEGARPPFPRAFETAQSALRYLGWLKDEKSYDDIVKQFDSKEDKELDITDRGLIGTGRSMLAMCLRALAVGASMGLAQWGPVESDKAEERLVEFIEDFTWHESARLEACYALAWIGKPKTLKTIPDKVKEWSVARPDGGAPDAGLDPQGQFISSCYSHTLTRAPQPESVAMLIDLITAETEVGLRNSLALAVGISGLKPGSPEEGKLFEKIQVRELTNAAALALVLGGNADAASRAVAIFADKDKIDGLTAFKDLYFNAFGYWSDRDLDSGNIYRWVENAEAISRVRIGDAPQEWAGQRLVAQFDNLQFDNGPHSETRVVLRYRLVQAAKKGDTKQKEGAIRTLRFMKEQGSLMALKGEKGETGQLAAEAFHKLMNPKLLEEEDLSHLKKDDGKK